jgi:Na+-transporting methylmalonyl-CoA/oxaloacetate decarboxylase gamma subunit
MSPGESDGVQLGGNGAMGLAALQQSSGQKIISDGRAEIEVKSGDFENAFSQALLIADRYGGYLVSSTSQTSGEEGGLRSGTIAVRVPVASFANALADAGKIGKVKSREVQTQDVTEEYVDLQARIANSKAHVQALLALLAKAKTVDEVLQVQQVLTSAQQELEQLEGRQRFLDEHTNYSTLTLVIYEAGVVVAPSGTWGIVEALKDGLHNLVDAFNAIVRGLGILVPVLVVLAIVAYIVYRVWKLAVRRRRAREAGRIQTYPQGWGSTWEAGAPQPQAAAPADRSDKVQG